MRSLVEEIRLSQNHLPDLELIALDEADRVIGYAMFSRLQLEGRYGDELLLEGRAPYSTSVQDGYLMAKELVASGKKFTAAICTNDLMAMGAISAFNDAGYRVPEDISVMGFDDILFARVWRPAITTMAVSKFDFGRKAFDLLYTNMKKGSIGYSLCSLELKVRDSTAALG